MTSPVNAEEIYNLRHAQARNVVERIFGVLKERYDILNNPPNFSMDIQIRIPPALAAMHNFILRYDPDDLEVVLQEMDGDDRRHEDPIPALADGLLATGAITRREETRASAKRDRIATKMWADYQRIVAARALEQAQMDTD